MTIPRAVPGLAFSVICDRGFVVGLQTHKDPKMGPLIWLSQAFFEEEPSIDDVAAIDEWRWCVFFPLGAALKRSLVTAIGKVDVPEPLVEWPEMRAGSRQQGWFSVPDGDGSKWPMPSTDEMSLPPRILVNDTRLKEMLVSGWVPEDHT